MIGRALAQSDEGDADFSELMEVLAPARPLTDRLIDVFGLDPTESQMDGR